MFVINMYSLAVIIPQQCVSQVFDLDVTRELRPGGLPRSQARACVCAVSLDHLRCQNKRELSGYSISAERAVDTVTRVKGAVACPFHFPPLALQITNLLNTKIEYDASRVGSQASTDPG